MEDGIMKKSLFIAAALLTLAACSREMNIDTPAGDMSITARTETSADTRTVVEGQTHVYWEPGDEIMVFAGGKSGKFTTDISASSASATFNGTLGDHAWMEGMDLWAVYPYSEDAVFYDGTITTVLPSEQVARAGSFGKEMNLAIAHSMTSDLQFYNVGGGIRFTLSQDGITEVVLEGLKKETLAGKVKVGFQDGKPVIQEVTEGKTSITITPPDGEAFQKNAWYYIVAIPGDIEAGFTFHFKKANDPSLVMPSTTYPKSVTIKRGIYGTLTQIDKAPSSSYSVAVPEAIDLGLPSGLKWASFNLGATKPEEYGDYFAWGETEPKSAYSWETYKWSMGTENSYIKYCPNPDWGYNGFSDERTQLVPEDDAASVNLGDKWRIPTAVEMDELLRFCDTEWTSENGISGHKLTGPNGNSIFLPFAGAAAGTERGDFGTAGAYWTSSLSDSDNSPSAWLFLTATNVFGFTSVLSRCYGISIRPVYGNPTIPVESISLDITEVEMSVDESIQLTATIIPDNAYETITWFSSDESVATVSVVNVSERERSSTAVVTAFASGEVTISVSTEGGRIVESCIVTVKSSSTYTFIPKAIDLGLPSGLKWASYNLGASKPEGYGDYYAWGETEPYYNIWSPSIWMDGKDTGYSWASYKWCKGAPDRLTKYCTKSNYGYQGFTDNKTVLDLEDDAAYVKLDKKWRMPTIAEWAELRANCIWEWTTINDTYGLKIKGPNGNSIFLPAAGFRDGKDIYFCNYYGEYWSSSLCTAYPDGAGNVSFNVDDVDIYLYDDEQRFYGHPIRPVRD